MTAWSKGTSFMLFWNIGLLHEDAKTGADLFFCAKYTTENLNAGRRCLSARTVTDAGVWCGRT
jgi:hypothetical protein